MKKFPTPLFLIALAAALLAGCRSSNTAMVGLNVELAGITREGAEARVAWRVVNPNIVSYLVAQANHRIYLDGVLVGTATDRDALAVPAQSKADRTSPLALAGPAAERAVAAAAATGSATYRLESTVTIRLYGETTDRSELRAAGTVPVSVK